MKDINDKDNNNGKLEKGWAREIRLTVSDGNSVGTLNFLERNILPSDIFCANSNLPTAFPTLFYQQKFCCLSLQFNF